MGIGTDREDEMTHERVIDTPYVHGEPFPNGVYRVHYYDNGRWTDRMLHINGNSIMWSRQIDDWGAVTDSGIPWDRQTLVSIEEAGRIASALREQDVAEAAEAIEAACRRSRLGWI